MSSAGDHPAEQEQEVAVSSQTTGGSERKPDESNAHKALIDSAPNDKPTPEEIAVSGAGDRGLLKDVCAIIGVTTGWAMQQWENGAEARRELMDKISEGLEQIGQNTQENIDAIGRFLSEKSLERKEPGRPTAENTGGEFEAPKRGKATTGKNESGQEGWLDAEGRVWVPTNGRAAHGGEHWDVAKPDGSGHVNIYPGGHVRSNIDGVDIEPTIIASADRELHRNIDDKTRMLFASNDVPATEKQIENAVAKVFADARENKLASVSEMHLTTGKDGNQYVIAMPAANDAPDLKRSATDLKVAMETPAQASYEKAVESPRQEENLAQSQSKARSAV